MRIKINIQIYTRNIKTKVTNNKINDGNDGNFKIALLREKKAIKALNLKLKGVKSSGTNEYSGANRKKNKNGRY